MKLINKKSKKLGHGEQLSTALREWPRDARTVYLTFPSLLYMHLFSFQPLAAFPAIFQQRVPASTYIRVREARAWSPLSIYCGATEAVEREREREGKRAESRKLEGGKVRKREKPERRGESRGMARQPVEFAGRVQLPSHRVRLTLYESGYFCGQVFLRGLLVFIEAPGPELGQWRGHRGGLERARIAALSRFSRTNSVARPENELATGVCVVTKRVVA